MKPTCKGSSLFVVFLIFSSIAISAKDFDTTLEKPDVLVKPDKHRIFLRALSGDGAMITPAQEEIRGADNALTIASVASGSPTLYASTFGPQFQDGKTLVTSTTKFDLEYRFEDKFRFFYETRKISQDFAYGSVIAGAFNLRSVPVSYVDTQKRIGLGYFFPVLPMLNLGASLRRVELQQTTDSNFTGFSSSLGSPSITYFSDSSQTVKMTGYVPGFGIEFKPLSWFEIHFQHLLYNLKGNDSRFDSLVLTSRGLSAVALSLGEGGATYKGYSQTIDFVFRYSSWFATRWGYTKENYLKTNNVYSFSNLDTNPALAIGSSIFVQALSEANVKYGSYNLTIEFSKGFGSN
ncbi:hypothetical protein EHQ58_15165 [Leptospira ognonensis]|uniref:Porin n=1 Tax=Leptospira ognonensis TaxID=2484945 RepID=A0A4R9JY57_9LEPT|nr:hypothetical protein [Leptospira ognonensis]TGL57125.1 hypothetical protein EHQ58_15165 [Leptospira ognonensis]